MRRPIARQIFAAVALIAAAAVHPAGAAALRGECNEFHPGNVRESVEGAAVIVVASLAHGPADDSILVMPELYLKGTADRRSFLLQEFVPGACEPARLQPGTQMLLVLESAENRLAWPDASRAFILQSGTATNGSNPPWSLPEAELRERIQDLTGQEAVPIEEGDDEARIDWVGTVLPVTVALGIVFGIGLVMMRVWHRIDPS